MIERNHYDDEPITHVAVLGIIALHNKCLWAFLIWALLVTIKILDVFKIHMLKGSGTGLFVKVSLWYASLLTNTRFRFLYFTLYYIILYYIILYYNILYYIILYYIILYYIILYYIILYYIIFYYIILYYIILYYIILYYIILYYIILYYIILYYIILYYILYYVYLNKQLLLSASDVTLRQRACK